MFKIFRVIELSFLKDVTDIRSLMAVLASN